MKDLYILSLVCAFLFKDADFKLTRWFFIQLHPEYCDMDLEKNEGCNSGMRMFGSNYQYRCNCKHVSSCEFKNKGSCWNDTCLPGFSGPYCQRISYMTYFPFPRSIMVENYQDIWTNETRKADLMSRMRLYSDDSCSMSYHKNFRINNMIIHCRSNDNFTIYIGPNKFCQYQCHRLKCHGNASSETAIVLMSSFGHHIHMYGCMRLWFGIDCDKQCHCANNAECDVLTGLCPLGCENGWSGHNCQELNFENVALNKKANQSSTQNKGLIFTNGTCQMDNIQFSADLAIDGNIDQQVERFSCMQTEIEKNPFWEVDLGKKYNISQIRIYNMNSMRTFYNGRISVFVDGEICNNNSFITPTAPSVIDIMCTNVLSGTSVRIVHNGFASLHFCEVEVLQCLPGYCGYRCSFNWSKFQMPNNSQKLCQQFNEMKDTKTEFYIILLVIGICILIIINVIQVVVCVLRRISKTKKDAKAEVKPKPTEMKAISAKDVEYMNINDVENDENLYDIISPDAVEGVVTNMCHTEENLYENNSRNRSRP